MSTVISFRIDKKLKKRMDKLRHINWSEIVRKAISEVVAREEARMRGKDIERLKNAALKSEGISRRIEGWSGVEEIRRWRERR